MIVQLVLSLLVTFITTKLVLFLLKWRRMHVALAGIPSPSGIPIFGNAIQLATRQNENLEPFLREEADKILETGGNLMKIQICAKYFTIALNGQALKPILDSSQEITKSCDYEFLWPWIGQGLLTSTNEKWRTRRRMLTPTFHFKMLDGYNAIFDKYSKRLCKILEKHDGEEIDLCPYVKNCALDIICESAMGVTVNALENESNPYVDALVEMGRLVMSWALNPLNWFFPYWWLSGNRSRYYKSVEYLTSFTKRVIAQRKIEFEKGDRKKLGDRVTFLDFLLEANAANNLSDEDIREEVDTFMFEGHDTTSAGMLWILWCLAHHSEIQEKVFSEISSNISHEDELTNEALKKITYLDTVIKESHRLFPPVPIVQRVLQNDFQSGDHILPKNSIVWISPMMVHRNKQVYGDDVLEFKPSRWDEENVQKHVYNFIPFSAGLRNCIGQRFAHLEEKILITRLVLAYKIHPTSIAFNDNKVVQEIVTKPSKNMILRLEKRT